MSIARLLQDSALEPAVHEGLRLAFSGTLRLLGLVDRNDPVCEIVACKIVEIGATGASDPVAISEIALRQLGAFIAVKSRRHRPSQRTSVDRTKNHEGELGKFHSILDLNPALHGRSPDRCSIGRGRRSFLADDRRPLIEQPDILEGGRLSDCRRY